MTISVSFTASKCASCDQRNATIYNADSDSMYCHACHDEKLYYENTCYCSEDNECIPCQMKEMQEGSSNDY